LNFAFRRPQASGFTLIELILVMSLLIIAVGLSFPALQDFFRGRGLDSEARRFLSLVRYGQSRAVSEGIPMLLWIDPREGTYGLQAEAGYLDVDNKAVEFELDENLRVEVSAPAMNSNSNQRMGMGSFQRAGTAGTAARTGRASLSALRFSTDGSLVETSPEFVQFQQNRPGQQSALWIVQTPNRLSYEIRTTEPQLAR
jgi:type II secretory pathway pseudopilin PulG